MTDDNRPLTVNYTDEMGYTYHPKQDVWVAWHPDGAKRVEQSDTPVNDLTIDGNSIEWSTTQEW